MNVDAVKFALMEAMPDLERRDHWDVEDIVRNVRARLEASAMLRKELISRTGESAVVISTLKSQLEAALVHIGMLDMAKAKRDA